MKQKILEFLDGAHVVARLSIDLSGVDSLALDHTGTPNKPFDCIRVFSGSSGQEKALEELQLLPGATARLTTSPGNSLVQFTNARVRCYLCGGSEKTASCAFEVRGPMPFQKDVYFQLPGSAGGKYLFKWDLDDGVYVRSVGDGIPLTTENGTEVDLVPSIRDEAFLDALTKPDALASRMMLKRIFGDWKDAVTTLQRSPQWAGGECFEFADSSGPRMTCLQWNQRDGRTSRVALKISRWALFDWWNRTVSEMLAAALHTVRDGGFASFIPSLKPLAPAEMDPLAGQLRFTFLSDTASVVPVGPYQVEYQGLRQEKGTLDPVKGIELGHLRLALHGFTTHSGRPLELTGDVRINNLDPEKKPCFWHLHAENLKTQGETGVRLGAMDLLLDGKDGKIEVLVDRVWSAASGKSAQNGRLWRYSAKVSPSQLGASIPYLSLQNGRLPLLSFAPGGQDELTSEQGTLNSPFTEEEETDTALRPFGRESPLVMTRSKGSGDLSLVLTEMSRPNKNHESQVAIMAKDLKVGQGVDACVLDMQPFNFSRVEVVSLGGSTDEGIEVARWSSSDSAGASWHVRNPVSRLVLPPQAVGEATEKWLAAPTDVPGSAGTVPEDGPDIGESELADMRFGQNARIEFNSTFFAQNFGEPGWNLRRLMGDVGQRDPGVKVLKAAVELLYGLNGVISYPHLRLAEIATRLGEVPAQIPSDVFGLSFDKLTPEQQSALKALQERWKNLFAAYLSRLAILEPRDEHDLRDELKKRDGVLLTEGVSFHLRTPRDIQDKPEDYGHLPPTPRLRYPISKARLAVTPGIAMPSKLDHHADDATAASTPTQDSGLPGGFQWGFESVAIYEELWRKPKSTSAELAQLAFSALGGYGKLKARFSNDKTIIQAHVGMGRTHYYTLERVGRIAAFWVRAKHVIVYERSVVPSPQFYGYQDDQAGRPVLRKVKEYIEILEPEKSLPDQDSAPEDCGPLRGIVFHDRIIPVHGSWGHDVYEDEQHLRPPIGWEIPLWRSEGVDTRIYPKPHVSLRFPADATAPEQKFLADMSRPQNLWFFTDTRDAATADVMSWPPVHGVDYIDAAVPPAYLEGQDHAADHQALDGDLDDPIGIAPGFERFTFQLDRTEQKANLVAGRTDQGQVSAIMRNITMMRASAAVPAQGDEALQKAQEAMTSAAAVVTALDQQLESAARRIELQAVNKAADVQKEVARVLEKAKSFADKINSAAAGLKAPEPPASAWCKKPLLYRFIEQPLRQQIDQRRKDALDQIEVGLFAPWQQILSQFDKAQHADIQAAKAHLKAAIRRSVNRFHENWMRIEGSLSLLMQVPEKFLTDAEQRARGGIDRWLGGLSLRVRAVGADVNTTEQQLKDLLDKVDGFVVKALSDADGLFMREIGTIVKPFLETIDITDPENPAQKIKAWAWIIRLRDRFQKTIRDAIAAGKTKIGTSPIQDIAEDVAKALDQLRDDLIKDAPKHLLHDLSQNLHREIADLVTPCEAALEALNKLVEKTAKWVEAELLPELDKLGANLDDFASALIHFVSAELAKMQADLISRTFDPAWTSATGLAEKLVKSICAIEWTIFPIDLQTAEGKIKDWLADKGEWMDRIGEIAEAYAHDAKMLANKIRDAGKELCGQVQAVSAQVQQGLAQARRAAGAVDGLAQAASSKLRAFRAFCESPAIFPVKLNRQHIALVISEGRKLLDMTPVVARFEEGKKALAALGLRLPSRQLLDRIVPVKLDSFDISRVFSDLGGIRFDDFLPNLKMPSISDENIKVSHGFDKETLRAWVHAEADVDLPTPATLFSIGPIAVTLRSGNFTALVDMQTDAEGRTSKQSRGAVRGAWDVTIGGTSIVTFDDTSLTFVDGKLRFNLQPAKIQLNAVLKMISDLLPDMGGDEEDDGPGLTVALTTINFNGIKIPSGVRVKLDLPLPDLAAGTTAITGLHLGAFFRLRALGDDFSFNFQIATGFNLGRKTSPFNLTIFLLGGGGWIEVEATYAPRDGTLSTSVTIGVNASAILAINLGVVSGTVGVYFGVFAEFHMTQGQPGGLVLGVFVMVRGEVDVLGIINVYLMLMLEAVYERTGGGKRLIGRGTVELRIKICWCFTLKVKKSVTYQLAGSSNGGGGGGTKALPAAGPDGFKERVTAAKHQAALVK